MVSIYTLEPGANYLVTRAFPDCCGDVFAIGERLTYVERHFVPYHGGHTLVFKERSIFLQEEENADIIEAFGEYFSQVE